MRVQEKVKSAISSAGTTQTALAERVGTKVTALNQKISRGKFSVDELERIAEALGAKFEYRFVFPDGTEI